VFTVDKSLKIQEKIIAAFQNYNLQSCISWYLDRDLKNDAFFDKIDEALKNTFINAQQISMGFFRNVSFLKGYYAEGIARFLLKEKILTREELCALAKNADKEAEKWYKEQIANNNIKAIFTKLDLICKWNNNIIDTFERSFINYDN
jgi:hypothetical protein